MLELNTYGMETSATDIQGERTRKKNATILKYLIIQKILYLKMIG
jgi:hypothetical protein